MAKQGLKFEKSMVFLIIIFAVIIIASVILVFALQVNPVEQILENGEPLKILFVLKDDQGVLFTDVLVSYPLLSRGALFSVPGNTGAIYSSIGRVDRIDAIFMEKGVDVYRSEIEKLLNQEIPFSIVIDVKDFQILTDYLGGLKVFIPHPIDMTNETGERWLLPSGYVNLDGDKIHTYLYYYSQEESAGAIIDRYQNVMTAFLGALEKNSALIFEDKNFKNYGKLFSVNVDMEDLESLLKSIASIDSERLVFHTISGYTDVIDGKTLLMPRDDGQVARDLFNRTILALTTQGETMFDRTYVLEVQNGTSVQGLARNTAILFRGHGYDVLNYKNADSNDYEKTVIINHIGNEEVAQALGNLILCNNIKLEEVLPDSEGSNAAQVDFTVILGEDFDGRYVRGN
ncbi:MAG: LytR family transcriptional regulator [Spirochaetaceae bacterium]|nr:LytR family transcriptional regulator [Spirochaetaceae bacterium]